MIESTLDNILYSSSSVPSVKFSEVGSQTKIKITNIQKREKRDFDSGEILLNKSGQTIPELLIDGIEIGGSDEEVRIYASKYAMIAAIKDALSKAGMASGSDLAGGMLTVKRLDDLEPTRKGLSGAHQFVAKYEPAKPSATFEDLI